MEHNFDITFFSFSDPRKDARTYNLVKLIAKSGKKVGLMALGLPEDVKHYRALQITFFPIEESKSTKMSIRWSKFKTQAKLYYKKFRSLDYFACDLWSLPVARDLYRRAKLDKYPHKLYYDSREIYSSLGPIGGKGIKQALITQAEKVYVDDVDVMITSGLMDSDYLKKHFKNAVPYYEIYNYPAYKSPLDVDLLRKKSKISQSKTIFIYQGVLLPGRGLTKAIDAIELVKNGMLFIVGEGPAFGELKEYVETRNLSDKVVFTGSVPYTRLHEITCSADVGLALFEPVSKSYELSLPNKMFEYCMAGIPTIATDLPQMAKVMDTNEIGILVDKELDVEDLADKMSFLTAPYNRDQFKEVCERAARDYSYEAQKKNILEIFKKDDY